MEAAWRRLFDLLRGLGGSSTFEHRQGYRGRGEGQFRVDVTVGSAAGGAVALQRRARQRASQLGISLAQYLRNLVAADLGPRRRRAGVSAVFALGASQAADVAREKDAMLAAAFDAERRRRKRR